LIGLNSKEVGRMTYRKFRNLYYHYQKNYDFQLKKISYERLEELIIEEEEWIKE